MKKNYINYTNLKWLRNYIYCNKNEYKSEEWTFILEKLDNIIKNYKEELK